MLFDPEWKSDGWLWPNRAVATVALFAVMFGPAAISLVITLWLMPPWSLWLVMMAALVVVQQTLIRGILRTYPRNGWM